MKNLDTSKIGWGKKPKINARQKGHSFERDIVNELKEMGYAAITSRMESKRMDDLGVDIIDDTPFYIQCKAVERLGSIHKVLAKMPTEKTPIVLHKKNNQGTIVAIRWADFKKLML